MHLGIFINFVQETTYRKNVYPEAAIDLVNYVCIIVVNVSLSSMSGGKKGF